MSVTSGSQFPLPVLDHLSPTPSLSLCLSFSSGAPLDCPSTQTHGDWEGNPSLDPKEYLISFGSPRGQTVPVCGKAACPGVSSLEKPSGVGEHETSVGPQRKDSLPYLIKFSELFS